MSRTFVRRSPNDSEGIGLGQFFTPPAIVDCMLQLVRNSGRVLEPACGDGAFLRHFPDAVGIEIDPYFAPPGARIMDFFALPEDERFFTIIGNPPYVRYQDIPQTTRCLTRQSLLDGRANLYLFFIEKCLRHLEPGGELIFITPRELLKATSAIPLNRLLYEAGTITDFIDLGDLHLFDEVTPNCAIWRFELDERSRKTRYSVLGAGQSAAHLTQLRREKRYFTENNGQLFFTRHKSSSFPQSSLSLRDIAFVKVGAVSGADALYASKTHGNRDFVCSSTVSDGQTRRMIWCEPDAPPPALLPHKARLLARRIRKFDESNWWYWGRGYYQSALPRVYVNNKTRHRQPFFVHDCPHYDGAVLAIFPHRPETDVHQLAAALNAIDWEDLGFVCDGRFLFTQRSLEQATLPASFRIFLPCDNATPWWKNSRTFSDSGQASL